MSSDFAGDDPAPSQGAAEATDSSDRDAWLSPQERAAWLTLHALLLKLPGRLDQQLQRDADLSHFEYLVLAVLAERSPPRLRMSQLSILTSGSLSRLSHVAKRLESKNYIVRETDEFDRRSTNAALTAEGLAKVRSEEPLYEPFVTTQTAREAFESVLAVKSDDGPSLMYLERCWGFERNPPAEDWDGVWPPGE